MDHLRALYLWLEHELGGATLVGAHEGGSVPLKQLISLEVSIRPVRDGPVVESAPQCVSLQAHKAFCFLTYMFLSTLYSLIHLPSLFSATSYGWDTFNRYVVEEEALLLEFDRFQTPFQPI